MADDKGTGAISLGGAGRPKGSHIMPLWRHLLHPILVPVADDGTEKCHILAFQIVMEEAFLDVDHHLRLSLFDHVDHTVGVRKI